MDSDVARLQEAQRQSTLALAQQRADLGLARDALDNWLAGFNGGPLRAPSARIPDRLMKVLRQGLTASGMPVTDTPDSEFFTGRFPV